MKRSGYLQCSGDDWQKARMRTLVRDNFTCQYQALGLTPEENGCCEATPEARLRFLQVHHIKSRINGGSHDLSNLVTLCRLHHAELHPHMRFEESYSMPERDYQMKEL